MGTSYIAGMSTRLPAFFLFLLFISLEAVSQQTITGTVVDAETGKLLPGASVFISNTSKGTVSNRDGAFVLEDLPVGQQELIVSSIGYETSSYPFSSAQLPLKVLVKMQVKIKELENVTVEPSVLEGWSRWGKLFTDQFIGTTRNAARCKIKNYKAIKFRYFKKSNRVIAWCDEPIVIENKALGYTLKYQLETFEIRFSDGATTYAGYPFFEDHQAEGKKVKNKWQRERYEAYAGSMLHFMRSIYNGSLETDGFEVRRMVRSPNYEKQRVAQIHRTILRFNNGSAPGPGIRISNAPPEVSGNGRQVTIRLQDPGNANSDSVANDVAGIRADSAQISSPDSLAYYRRILEQKDYIDTYARTTLTADSLIIERSETARAVWFDNYLYITFKKETEDQLYLDFHAERRSPTFQRSLIWLVNRQPIVIDEKGSYSPPQEVFAMSYWGWSEKMSDMLPIDFQPIVK